MRRGPIPNAVYAANFEPPLEKNIEFLDPALLEGKDLWMMSPPCQPFCKSRGARADDVRDLRCTALFAICNRLEELERPPKWIALENVTNFARSAMTNSNV